MSQKEHIESITDERGGLLPGEALRMEFLEAMRAVATPVSVVTTDGVGGRYGLTVSSLNSVCVEPPVVSICVNRRSPAVAAIEANGRLVINVLAAGSSEVAGVFAGQAGRFAPFDFGCAEWGEDAQGVPTLDSAVAGFSCAVLQGVDVGTHRLFLCAVESVVGRVRGTASAAEEGAHTLLHYRRGFHRPAPVGGA